MKIQWNETMKDEGWNCQKKKVINKITQNKRNCNNKNKDQIQ